jgi:hypothetical protein
MTCRAKTYGNSFMEEWQKENMEGSGTLRTTGDQAPLEWGRILRRNVLTHQGQKLTGTISQGRVGWKSETRYLLGKVVGDP